MLRVTDRTRAREFNGFRQLCEREARLLGGAPKAETTGLRDPAGGDDQETVKTRIRQSQSAIDDAFVSGWTEWSRHRHILITMDSLSPWIPSNVSSMTRWVTGWRVWRCA
ncbi:hypothetical protein FDG2_6195 [Candidatus Protofrankia californiensis]|uniref:Uncharacterized protein n=1 Tax=Candidatus Protofrankia californiensis TaxID=1839754 RepID=A0A1C3PGG6_9ACTN|nr:hypothetical protein FDG2_6195 [Candidatus Protofrankia californiensis]